MEVKILKQRIEAEILVESDSKKGAFYFVTLENNNWACTCLDFQNRGTPYNKHECKHIRAAKDVI
jgi:hypothetical protein